MIEEERQREAKDKESSGSEKKERAMGEEIKEQERRASKSEQQEIGEEK